MKKTNVLMALAIVGIIGCCLPLINAELIQDLGTVEYMNSLQVDVDSDESLDLYFIDSNWNENDLTITNYGFDPLLNKTRFLFTSELVEPEWYMTPGFVAYLYQDDITGQIYRIYINFSSLEIPLSPLELELMDILNNYIDLENNTDLFNATRFLLQDFYEQIQNKNNTLNDTTNQLNYLINQYYNLSDNYNLTCIELQNLTINLTNTITNYDLLNDTYNQTYSNWLKSSGIAGKYEEFKEDVTKSNQDIIWFNNEQYKTNSGYNREIKKLKSDIEIGNLILIFGIILTVIICFVVARILFKKRGLTREELENDYAYPEEAKKMDDFINGPTIPKKTLKQKISFIKKIFFKPKTEPENINVIVDKLITKMDDIKNEIKTDVTNYVDERIQKNIDKKTKPVKP